MNIEQKRLEAVEQQLRYALHALQAIVDGSPTPAARAALAIKHITVGGIAVGAATAELRDHVHDIYVNAAECVGVTIRPPDEYGRIIAINYRAEEAEQKLAHITTPA